MVIKFRLFSENSIAFLTINKELISLYIVICCLTFTHNFLFF